MADYIFKHGTVVTMDQDRRVIPDGAVVVSGNMIEFVGSYKEAAAKYKAKQEIDCSNHIIMPGLVDAHGHAGHSFTRFVVKDTKHWMPAMTHMYKHYVDDDFWYVEGKISALQRLKSGVTTGVCVMGSQPRCDDPIFAINNAKAYAEVGVRDIVCTGPCHTPWPHNFSRWENGKRKMRSVSFEEVCESLETVIKTLNSPDNQKTFAYVTPFGLITSINPSGATPIEELTILTEHDRRQAKEMKRISEKYKARIHTDCFGGMIHLAVQDKENMLMGEHVHIQHCTALSDFEIEVVAQTKTHAAVAPGSRAPVHKMLDAGINVVVTSDGPRVNYDLDMFSAMRLFQMNYRNLANDPTLLPHEKVLEMATINAAKALGLDHLVGSLEVGKRADIITVDLVSPRLMPSYNPVHTLVLSVTANDVDNVMIDGELLVSERKALKLDERKIVLDTQEMSDLINERAHFEKFAERQPLLWGKTRLPQDNEPFDLLWQREDGGHY